MGGHFCIIAKKIAYAMVRFRTIDLRLACSRLSVVGDERKLARKKRGRTKASSGGRACKTFFNGPLLQELLYPLIDQF